MLTLASGSASWASQLRGGDGDRCLDMQEFRQQRTDEKPRECSSRRCPPRSNPCHLLLRLPRAILHATAVHAGAVCHAFVLLSPSSPTIDPVQQAWTMTTLMHIALQATTPTQSRSHLHKPPEVGSLDAAYRASFCIHQGMSTSQVAAHPGPRSCRGHDTDPFLWCEKPWQQGANAKSCECDFPATTHTTEA